ncbi:MAG: CoA transferase [Alphaproteobacteria bacterium]|jgi:CoA:oxalate CoA-transferase|nr:CoA transferase [Alphaproteobacteria bacterium]MBT5482813.1 CoA transferase [Alphaproteobacteria bacterium]
MSKNSHDSADAQTKLDANQKKILEGVRVLDLTRFLSGPQATSYLAALGAEVVRIDDPLRGDPTMNAPPFFGPSGISMKRQTPDDIGVAYLKRARGKKSVAIDLKSKDGYALFLRLVKKADIIVENFRVGVTRRLGVDYESLRKQNPKLIYCSITGYGATGPESELKAYDLMVQASSGLMSVTGKPDGAPYKSGSSVSDCIAGTFALSGVLGALFQRTRTGEGQFIDVSMSDCLVSFIYDEPWDCYGQLDLVPRQGNRIVRFSPFNTYAALDGTVAIGAATEADWCNLLEVMGRTELKDDPNYMNLSWRISHNVDVDAIVGNWVKSLPIATIMQRCIEREIACSPIREAQDLVKWKHLQHRKLLTPTFHPDYPGMDGPLVATFPLKFSGANTDNHTPSARLGEHNDSVVEEWLNE